MAHVVDFQKEKTFSIMPFARECDRIARKFVEVGIPVAEVQELVEIGGAIHLADLLGTPISPKTDLEKRFVELIQKLKLSRHVGPDCVGEALWLLRMYARINVLDEQGVPEDEEALYRRPRGYEPLRATTPNLLE